jgi:hypothetical protein
MTDKYDYERFGSKAKRVGQAVYDILNATSRPQITAEDITEARQEQYLKDLKEAAELGKKEFQSPFYVVYIYNKEHWAENVVRGRFVRRQTEPLREVLIQDFPYFGKDVWKVDYNKCTVDFQWTQPALENTRQILAHKSDYDEKLVNETYTAVPKK